MYHISEQQNITAFIPRASKEKYNFKKYVWAISHEKVHHYFLPRDCPRICVAASDLEVVKEKFCLTIKSPKPSLLVVPLHWRGKIKKCTLFKYQFNGKNFSALDPIAGYFVSEQIEVPISKAKITDCLHAIQSANAEVVWADHKLIEEIKNFVVAELHEFSIIRWDNRGL